MFLPNDGDTRWGRAWKPRWQLERPAFPGGCCPRDQAHDILRKTKGSMRYPLWETPHALFPKWKFTINSNTLQAWRSPAIMKQSNPSFRTQEATKPPLCGDGVKMEGRHLIIFCGRKIPWQGLWSILLQRWRSHFFFFNAKVTLLMRFRKLALTMIAKTIRRGTMEARAVRRTGRSEFRFATHCLRDGPHTGLCGSTEIWF